MNELSSGWGRPTGRYRTNTKFHYFSHGRSACMKYERGYRHQLEGQVRGWDCCKKCYQKWMNDLAV
jgi:hypothetical protein